MPRPSLLGRTARAWVLALGVLVTAAAPAPAQDPPTPLPTPAPPSAEDGDAGPSFVLQPADGEDGEFVTITADPGETVKEEILLGNAGAEPVRLRTYAADTIPVPNGGFSVAAADVEPEGTATWITYPTEEIEFEPDEGEERTLAVAVPDDALPGQYIAGIVAETADPAAVAGSEQFTQVVRKAIAVFVTVPGPEDPEFSLGDPEFVATGLNATIEIPVVNSGNVLVKPVGEVTVRDAAGEAVLTRPVAMKSVYAGTTAPIAIPLSPPLPDGDYQVSATLADAETGAEASLADRELAIAQEGAAPNAFAIAGEVSLQPDEDEPVYADVAVEVANSGAPVAAAEVLLDVEKDGELVETFTLIPSLALPQGTTTATQRYIPPDGFAPGTWVFTLRLNTVDPGTKTTTTVATSDPLPPIEVGSR